MKTTNTPTPGFRGLNNVDDPMALGLSWLTRADDCVITSQKKLERAPGFTLRSAGTSISGAYVTDDLQRFYIADDGALQQINPGYGRRTLATLSSSAPLHFTEANGIVFFSNGVDYGTISPTGVVRAWGIVPPRMPNVGPASGELLPGVYRFCTTLREDATGLESSNSDVAALRVSSGGVVITDIEQRDGFTAGVYATEANGAPFYRIGYTTSGSLGFNLQPEGMDEEIPFLWCNAPHGILPTYFESRMYLADPYPTFDVSTIWRSHPLAYHLFQDGAEGVNVPGTVIMLKACKDAVIVGTEREIFSLDSTGKLEQLADYGVVPGDHAKRHEGKLYFWSKRGLCRALPFENLTEHTISVAPGSVAGATVIERNGDRRYVVAMQQGGSAFNPGQ